MRTQQTPSRVREARTFREASERLRQLDNIHGGASALRPVAVAYHDQHGRSRALQLKHSDYFFFPITMISRRAETGLAVDIEALYQQVAQKIANYYHSQRYD